MNVMILAAGEGTRLRPFTLEKPKPCIPFLSVPLACYSLALLDRLPVERLVVNTHHLASQVEALFASAHPDWKELKFSSEQKELLGSGGGIHNAETWLTGKGPFLVLNGDEVILPHEMDTIKDMMTFHKWHKGIATLLTMDHPDVGHKFGGAWLGDHETKIQCFSKTNPGAPAKKGVHFLGVLILSERIFQYFKPEVVVENILYETLTAAMHAGEEVHAFQTKAEWFETGNPTDFMTATEFCFEALKTKSAQRPYWQEYLKQAICLYSTHQHLIEKDWVHLPELKTLIQKIRSGN